jgi:alpha-N-arabinofuranosidase
MAADSIHYDAARRDGPKIFVGEWASQDVDRPWVSPGTKGPTPSLNAALGDAAWMAGMERNSDLVVMAAYAPLLVNVNPGARQWAENMIGFDSLTSFGSPSYYAQLMFARNLGDRVVPIEHTGLAPLTFCATRESKTGRLFLKVVNMSAAAQQTKIQLNGVRTVAARASAIVLSSSSPADINTIENPRKVTPVTTTFRPTGASFDHEFAPYSITVLVLQTR